MKYYFSVLIGCLFFAITISGYCQSPMVNEWHKGALVLNSHEVVTGKMNYSHTHDAVLLQSEGKVSVFTASQVISFYYIHHDTGEVYKYAALPYFSRKGSAYQRNFFFEVLLQGEVLYLRKPNKNARLIGSEYRTLSLRKIDEESSCYDYYMYYNEEVICINNFVTDALPLLARDSQVNIHEFIRSKRIREYTPHDKLVILHYFNAMHENEKHPDIIAQYSSITKDETE